MLVKIVAAAAVLAAGGVTYAVHASGGDDTSIATGIQRDMPKPSNYSFVALPDTPPPGNALVATSHYANDREYGQEVLFEYGDYTLYACSQINGVSAPRSCDSRDRDTLASVTRNGVKTTFSLGTKDGSAPLEDTSAVRTWVRTAQFQTAPKWVADYAHAQLERIYNG